MGKGAPPPTKSFFEGKQGGPRQLPWGNASVGPISSEATAALVWAGLGWEPRMERLTKGGELPGQQLPSIPFTPSHRALMGERLPP